ncbi:unnamed protein product, partial [Ectocarpus sp. 8 AP-2014]
MLRIPKKVQPQKPWRWLTAFSRTSAKGGRRLTGIRVAAAAVVALGGMPTEREVADPVMAALRGGGRTRSRVVTIQPAEPSTEIFLASIDSMGYDNALRHLENIGSTFAKDTRKRLRELEAKA